VPISPDAGHTAFPYSITIRAGRASELFLANAVPIVRWCPVGRQPGHNPIFEFRRDWRLFDRNAEVEHRSLDEHW
jgi:hypothetical protein